MKKLNLLFVSIFIACSTSYAQQLPQLSQYMINDFAINPAIAGMYDNYQIKTSVKNQWVGIDDAPVTTLLSVYGPTSNHVGIGGTVFNDQTGPTSRTGANLTYAYHFHLSRSIKLAMALSGGFTQFRIDKGGWNLNHTGDEFLQGESVDVVPDATFGINLYGEQWYLGGAVPQLLNSKLGLIDKDFERNMNIVDAEGNLTRHYYIMGLYNFQLGPYFDLRPSALFKSESQSGQNQIDFGLKTIYNDKFWLGVNYRDNGDISALLGFYIQDRYLIGYSYDIANSDLSEFTPGSHEFMFGISFKAATEKQIMR